MTTNQHILHSKGSEHIFAICTCILAFEIASSLVSLPCRNGTKKHFGVKKNKLEK
jgi:ATP/ADP translocase